MRRTFPFLSLAIVCLLAIPLTAQAQEHLCDTQFEDCRAPIINLIRSETVGIDVAFWFMEDARYVTELINRKNAGVPIRILVDTRANASKRLNADILASLAQGGLPMREKFQADILHFKMMLFHGQNVVEFSKANYTAAEFVPISPTDYDDEAVFFTNDDRLTNSFRRRFDDLWTDTTNYRNYANMLNPPVRHYPLFPIDPAMNFPPLQDFSNRSVSRYDQETQAIDAIVFRVTDHRQGDAMIRAVARGVPVRLISDPSEYRNPDRVFDAKQIDRMYMGGVRIKMRQHEGLTHEATVVLHALGEVIFGSSNWTTASASFQDEHNYFYNPTLGKPWFFQWFANHFNAKWNNATDFVAFHPLPPDPPVYSAPGNGTSGIGSSVTLRWEGGPWSHLYDIYVGTSSNPPLVAGNMELGSPEPGNPESVTVSNLQPGSTYFWRVVDKTWAQQTASGPVWTFTTAGTPPAGSGSTPFTNLVVPGRIEAEYFDKGGQFVAYFDTTAGNKGGAFRTDVDVDIQAAADVDGAYNIGWTRAGEWLKYTINVSQTGTYPLVVRVANVGTGGSFHAEIDGVNKTGSIAVPDTGGWQAWRTITVANISLAAGPHVLRVVFDAVGTGGGVGNYNWFSFGTSTAPSSGNIPYPPGAPPAAIPGVIQAENFDQGGEGVAYHDTSSTNSGGAYRPGEGVDIQRDVDVDGGFNVGWTKAGEWMEYTVNIVTAGSYQLNARVASLGAGGTFHIECDGVRVTGAVTVPNSGGWQSWQTISIAGVQLPAGRHVLRVAFDAVGVNGSVGNFNWFSFSH
jgi:hypothetical protein